jgi:hypothetical protein
VSPLIESSFLRNNDELRFVNKILFLADPDERAPTRCALRSNDVRFACDPSATRNAIPHSGNPIPRNDNPIPDGDSTIPVRVIPCSPASTAIPDNGNQIPDNDNGIPDNDNRNRPKFPVLRRAIAVTLSQRAQRQHSSALKFQKNSGCRAERGGISRRSLLFSCMKRKQKQRPVRPNCGHHHAVCKHRDFQSIREKCP